MRQDKHDDTSGQTGHDSGLVRMRTMSPMSWRRFGLMSVAGLGMTVTYPPRRASAATDIS